MLRHLEVEVLVLEDKLRVLAGKDAPDSRLADLASVAGSVLRQELLVGRDLLNLADVVQLLPRVVEVLAEGLVDVLPGRDHLLVEELRDEGEAAAAACSGLGAVLDLPGRREVLLADGAQDVALGHVVARADLK